jgi:glycosyltransferase involved in cell wall biosynthesis
MIVKDGGEDLRLCLESAVGVVHQIVVADTGSTDDSIRIAESFGARVIRIPWSDDFAEARNRALAMTGGDWVLQLDADEALPAHDSSRIPNILSQATEKVGGFVLTQKTFLANRFSSSEGRLARIHHERTGRAAKAAAYTETLTTRLFRRHPGIDYTGVIHESVDQRLAQAGFIKLAVRDFHIEHYGALTAGLSDAKKRWYRDLCLRKVEQQPLNHMAWRELGTVQYLFGEHDEVARCMERDYALSGHPLPLYYMAKARHNLGQLAEALQFLDRMPDAGDLGFAKRQTRGDVLADLGRLEEARLAYGEALALIDASDDLQSWKPVLESKLGYLEVRLGEGGGLERLRRALDEASDVYDCHDRLMKALIVLDRLPQAADAAEEMRRRFPSERTALRALALRAKADEVARTQEEIPDAGSDPAPQLPSMLESQSA